MDVRTLGLDDLHLIGEIDRSEHVEVEYAVIDGRLTQRPASTPEIPSWDPAGAGPHSVAAKIAFGLPLVAGGAALLGAFEDRRVLGVALVDGTFEPPLAWLAFLHVSRAERRRGVAAELWDAAVAVAVSAGATSMYVSATPTKSAVGFYLSRACVLADPVHPTLYASEPDDVHLVCRLQGTT